MGRPEKYRSAAVVSLVGAVGATVQVARIGHSGAEATWNKASGAQLPGPDGVDAALLQPFQPLL